MSNSPRVKFNLVNNNVEKTTPTQGISVVLARTTKGPQNDPSELINSVSKFNKIFGSEIVPDGSISNIEKALAGGSTLRIIRVQDSKATKGTCGTKEKNLLSFAVGSIKVGFNLNTKYKGDTIGSGSSYTFQAAQSGDNILYKVVDADGTTVLDSGILLTFKAKSDMNPLIVDYQALNNFFQSNPYFEPEVVTHTGVNFTSVEGMLDWLESLDGSSNALTVQFGANALTPAYQSITGTVGTAGADPVLEDWKSALECVKDVQDAYQVIASHVHQHLSSSDTTTFHNAVKLMADELQEWVYYIEVPKENNTAAKIQTWMKTTMAAVGNSKFVAYFGGGIKYYNARGTLKDCDVLGTIIGLGDASAVNYGPYRSFAGMNRGLIPDGVGPVCPNYGAPSHYDELNELANSYVNMIVVKDTRSAGKTTMLWHSFTSQVKQDSFRFLNIVRLVLYMKKTIRPIMESYIEEPNIWGTWKRIYLEVKPFLDNLVTDNAITDPQWIGDQDATSWDELQLNNEADCRQGKYHVQCVFKDVATMQDITIDLIIDSASKSVSATIND